MKSADKSEQSKQPPAIWDGEFSIVENKFLVGIDVAQSKIVLSATARFVLCRVRITTNIRSPFAVRIILVRIVFK